MTDLYQSQRAMRALRRAAMQRGVVAILDVGTSKIAAIVGDGLTVPQHAKDQVLKDGKCQV